MCDPRFPDQRSSGKSFEQKDLLDVELESTLTSKTAALRHSDQVHRKEPKSNSIFEAVVSDVVEEEQHNSRVCQKEEAWVEDRAIPVAPVKKQR